MVPRRHAFATTLIALSLTTFGCSRDLPTSSGAGAHRSRSIPAEAGSEARGRAVAILLPEAIASLVRYPEMGILIPERDGGGIVMRGPGPGNMHSTYFRTTPNNREFRQGFAEFAIPDLSEGFSGAQLVLRESRGGSSTDPKPSDRQELSSYTDVDFVVSASDFDRSTSPLGTFETDTNEPFRTFTFDIQSLFARSRGSGLGFRTKLEVDPTEARYGWLGSGFSYSSTPVGVTIEVVTTVPNAIDLLQGRIERMIEGHVLPAATKASLLRHLQLAEGIVRDRNPRNDGEARDPLYAIMAEVNSTLQRSGMNQPEGFYIMDSAKNIVAGLPLPSEGGSAPWRPGPAAAPAGRERG